MTCRTVRHGPHRCDLTDALQETAAITTDQDAARPSRPRWGGGFGAHSRRQSGDRLSAAVYLRSTMPVGEEAVVADAVEAVGAERAGGNGG